jgi:hypothetical protein
VIRVIFGPNSGEVTEDIMENLNIYTFHQIPCYNTRIITDNGLGRNAARTGYTRDIHNYDAKQDVNRPLERDR